MKCVVSAVLSASLLVTPCVTPNCVRAQQPDGGARHLATATAQPEEPRVTVHLDRVPLVEALAVISNQAKVPINYSPTVVPARRLTTVRVDDIAVSEAVRIALRGTSIRLSRLDDGSLLLFQGDTTAAAATGVITGSVVDRGTGRPVSGAVISIEGIKTTIRSQSDGGFRFMHVPTGMQRVTVRGLGYQAQTLPIEVKSDRDATLRFALVPTSTRLDEVVTTAAGQQRRLEVGNVIAHLNVDSIAKTAPVSSVTDILTGRVPGVQVINTSGMVGAGPSIKIRGQSSLSLAGDPIIIVDGVRQDNTPGGKTAPSFGGNFQSPSRINDIDIAQIATIDVLKGPAASAEYGTDAANGVIVITTKRGTAGAPRWALSAEHGWSDIPTDFEPFYYGWGHQTTGPDSGAATQCTIQARRSYLPNVLAGTCAIDSVTHFNPLNTAATSPYGHGLREKYNASVSGGAQSLTYYVGAGTSYDLGNLQLPKVFRPQALALGFPASAFDPNSQKQQSITANVVAGLGHGAEAMVKGTYGTTNAVTPLGITLSIGPESGPSLPDSAHGYGFGQFGPLYSLGTTSAENSSLSSGAARLKWNPRSWLTLEGITGFDRTAQQTQSVTPAQIGVAVGWGDGNGLLSIANTTTTVKSLDTRASAIVPLTPTIRSTSSMGFQSVRTEQAGLTALGQNMLTTMTSLVGVVNPALTQTGNTIATAGGFVAQQFGFSDRLFLEGSMRFDGASGFGGDARMTTYPRMSVSWLAYQRDGNTLRFRGALGAAGQQPENGASLQLYQTGLAYVDGSVLSLPKFYAVGNPTLRPERTLEHEMGFELSLYDNRVFFEATYYNKHTKDALVTTSLGFDLDNSAIQENLGDVRNVGTEFTLQLGVLRTQSTTWDITANVMSNQNKLLSVADGITPPRLDDYNTQRDVVGYSLNGYWGRKVSYHDLNHDGILTPDEITTADSASYLGPSIPKYTSAVSSSLGLWRGVITIQTSIDGAFDALIRNGDYNAYYYGYLPEQYSTTQPLWRQARALVYNQGDNNVGMPSLFFDDASYLRWRELSVTWNVSPRLSRMAHSNSLSITAAVRNLGMLWTKYPGNDPEVSDAGSGSTVNQFYLASPTYSNNLRASGGNGTPMPREWVIRVNAGL